MWWAMDNTASVRAPEDERRLERLVRAEINAIHRYASTRVSAAEVDDVVAEVFHAAAVAYGDGRATVVDRSWLFAVARNRVIDRWRRASRRKAIVHLAFNGVERDTAFPPDWTEDPRRTAVLAALNQLQPRHRILLILHHVDGVPVRELAEQANESVHATESALARARGAFRRHYKRDDEWTS